jgi:hypothetical protein
VIDVTAMNHEIQRYGHMPPLQPFKDTEFLCVRFRAGYFVGGIFSGSLKTQLDVIKPRFGELVKSRFIERKAGSYQIDVETGRAGGTNQFHNIGARERFASREIYLQNASFSRLAEQSRPDFGGKFVRTPP